MLFANLTKVTGAFSAAVSPASAISSRRFLTTLTSFSPFLSSTTSTSAINATAIGSTSRLANNNAIGLGMLQRRWKSRGNTFQPSTLKRKRRFGFLSRLKTKAGRKIVSRRKEKGRWYLSH